MRMARRVAEGKVEAVLMVMYSHSQSEFPNE